MTTEPIAALIQSLTQNIDNEDQDAQWSSMTVVIEFHDTEISETYGYVYGKQTIAVAPDPWEIEGAVKVYLATNTEHNETLPLKMLVQYDRTTGKCNITFEHTDPSRWQVTPANIDTIREELRPHLS